MAQTIRTSKSRTMPVAELPDVRPSATPAVPAKPARWRGAALYAALFALYFGVGYLLTMRYNLFDPDATSRVANAGYVLESRDPHLSAVGFVWNPLPSLVEVPILQLSRWWPELRSHGMAGVVQSALLMSAAAMMVRGIALDRRVGAGWRRLAVAAFAMQPMIVAYGASGMSEAAETFAVLWCVRHLMRWSEGRDPRDLAWAGLALATGYLARYEVIAAAVGAGAFVTVATMLDTRHSRLARALADMAIVMFPIVVAAAVWALSGWVVNQELFAPITSQYGNATQVGIAIQRGYLGAGGASEWLPVAARMFGMQPFVGMAAAGAMAYAVLARRPAVLVPVVIFGPVLAFAVWGQYTVTTFGWFRFYLLAIPLVVTVALGCWSPGRRWGIPQRLGVAVLVASIAVGFPVTVGAMLNERIGDPPLQAGLSSLLHPDRRPLQEVWQRRLLVNSRLLADYLDRQRLPDGAVLMDTAYTWSVWLSSSRPKQFVINSDYDFKATLNRPWEHDVQYLLVSNPKDNDADALSVRYATLWNDGAGMSRLVYSVDGPDGVEQFRLYRVTGPPRAVDSDRQGPL